MPGPEGVVNAASQVPQQDPPPSENLAGKLQAVRANLAGVLLHVRADLARTLQVVRAPAEEAIKAYRLKQELLKLKIENENKK